MEHRATGTEGPEGSWTNTARDVKDRTPAVADRATTYVRDAAERAADAVSEATGKPVGAWTRDVKNWVNSYPLQSAVVALGLGYLAGRMLRRY